MKNIDWIEKNLFITVLKFGGHGQKPFKIDSILKLTKEPDNHYDEEAIACEMRYFGHVGYVANSTQTVAKGTMSAGRIYDKIEDEYFAQVKFITKDCIIAKILNTEEYVQEMENPESDVHYLTVHKK